MHDNRPIARLIALFRYITIYKKGAAGSSRGARKDHSRSFAEKLSQHVQSVQSLLIFTVFRLQP